MQPRILIEYLKRLPHDRYVMHGSPHFCAVLEPRQALCYDPDGTRNEEKSQCAVYASISIETTLICALVHGNAGWTFEHDSLRICVHGGEARLGPGYVYILPQERFERLSNVFWFASRKPVTPLHAIPVGPEALRHFPNILLPSHLTRPA